MPEISIDVLAERLSALAERTASDQQRESNASNKLDERLSTCERTLHAAKLSMAVLGLSAASLFAWTTRLQSSVTAADKVATSAESQVSDAVKRATLETIPESATRAVSAEVDRFLPVGSIVAWPSRTAPPGWVVCAGQHFDGQQAAQAALDQWNIPALRAALGENTSQLPDYQGRFLMGAGSGASHLTTGGTAAIPSDGSHKHGGRTAVGVKMENTHIPNSSHWGEDSPTLKSHDHGLSADGAHDHGGDNRPPYYEVSWIIRVK